MENTLKEQLYSLHTTYSAIYSHFKRIETETARLAEERKALSEILYDTRELEKDIIAKLEELMGVKLTSDDILEIIKSYE